MNRHNKLLSAATKLRPEASERRYKCECGRAFTRAGNRQKHWRLGPKECRERHKESMPEVPRVDLGVRVPCLLCGRTFPNAIDMGLHQTREHFVQANATQRRSGGAWVN